MTDDVNVPELRRKLSSLEAMAGSFGWALFVEALAGVIDNARAVTENPHSDERNRVVASAQIVLARDLGKWPAEQISELQELINVYGGVE